jgi:hypothetical protein
MAIAPLLVRDHSWISAGAAAVHTANLTGTAVPGRDFAQAAWHVRAENPR